MTAAVHAGEAGVELVSCTAAAADSLTTGVEGLAVVDGGAAAAAVSSVVMLTPCRLSDRAGTVTLGRATAVAGRPGRDRVSVSEQPPTTKAIATVGESGSTVQDECRVVEIAGAVGSK